MHTSHLALLLALAAVARPADPSAPEILEGGLPGSKALVIALHGGSFDDRPPAELARRLLTDLSSESRAAGLRLLVPVAPAAPPGTTYVVPWLRPEGELMVLSLMHREIAARRADPRRVHLAGHGAGATGAFTLASRHADLVAGVAAWSGTPEPLWDEERRVVGLAEPVVQGLRGVPVFIFTARDDRLLDRATLRLFLDGLQRQAEAFGGPAPLWIEGEGGHGFGSAGPARGLRFLRDQKKPAARQAVSGS